MSISQIVAALHHCYIASMAPQEIQKMLKSTPFIPFKVFVEDGSVYEIHDPGDAVMSLIVLTIGIDPDDESGLFRNTINLSPSHVSRLAPMPAATR